MAILACNHQWGDSIVIRRVGVCTVVNQQEPRDIHMAILACNHQWGDSIVIRGVGVGALLEHLPGLLEVSTSTSIVQRWHGFFEERRSCFRLNVRSVFAPRCRNRSWSYHNPDSAQCHRSCLQYVMLSTYRSALASVQESVWAKISQGRHTVSFTTKTPCEYSCCREKELESVGG